VSRAADEALALGDFAGGGVTPLSYADGSCGVRGVDGATAFPSALTLAAAFDVQLAERYGRMLAREVRAAGHNAVLAPALDLGRDPRSGRLGENLGEDPLLAGELGGHVVRGVHAEHVVAVVKHYVANNLERLRTGSGPDDARSDAIDVRVSPRALHESYLEPFRRAVAHGAVALMGSYNRVDGEYVCQSAELLRLPRERWGFTGFTVPDFIFAVRDARAALEAGLDLPGLDELAGRTPELVAAASDELVAGIGEHVRAAIAAVELAPPTGERDAAGLGSAEALELAETIATSGAVLLRNAGVLPLAPGARIALVGADQLLHALVVGGAASVTLEASRIPELVDSLEKEGLTVAGRAAGVPNVPLPPLAASDTVRLTAVVHDASGTREFTPERAELAAPGSGAWSAQLTAVLPAGGPLVASLEFGGEVEVLLDGAPLAAGFREASPMVTGPHYVLQTVVPASSDERVLEVRYRTGPAIEIPFMGIAPHVSLGARELEPVLASARAATSGADAVVVLAGRVTGEAMDADELALPGGQDELIEALVDTGVPVIVVTHGAGPVLTPWRERVAALLHLGHPGERIGPALAAMLSGRREPGGRLVLSWPAAAEAVPVPSEAAVPDADARVHYVDGVDIGYRAYERQGVEPAFSFGHGLGYARIAWEGSRAVDGAVEVTLAADASRGGKAVVQLYARQAEGETLALAGFASVHLAAGERRTVRVEVDPDAVGVYDPARGERVRGSDEVPVWLGFSRSELRDAVTVRVARP